MTRDKDFGALIIQHRHAHSGLIRVVELSTRQSLEAVLAAAGTYGEELEAGAIVVADPKRMRIRFDDHDE